MIRPHNSDFSISMWRAIDVCTDQSKRHGKNSQSEYISSCLGGKGTENVNERII